ncbi:general amidase [Exophiala viscosa]|uniref:general amidase n=1 Tax=Exophiala viscosa TaxID=2486360 RepID=UPI0021964E6B|nr:general amidase [Exophiala viscosa]
MPGTIHYSTTPFHDLHLALPKDIPPWKRIAQAKRASRDAAIPLEWRLHPHQVPQDRLNVIDVPVESGILTARELAMTEDDAVALVQKLVNREYSSYEVTLAFCKRAAIAQQLVNCLTEVFFERALEAAQRLDAEYAASDVTRGPLHGLPVSLKDCFHISGTDATIGYTALANQPTSHHEESEITRIMRESGAILFCKTNVPVALMAGETYNAIYGYTSNPYNRNLSSGGSSGGESALLALRGAPLGVGTDVGGSVRIPASFCGLYSLKPSFGRFPTYGLRDGLEGQEAVRNSVGPMARSLKAVELWSKAVVQSEPWIAADHDCLPIPWRKVEVPQKLCFGILLDDGIVKPLPPVTRALLHTKAALEAAGHTVIEFCIVSRDEPLFIDSLKFALYRSAAAQLLGTTLARTQEPWPRGYAMLEAMVQKKILTTEELVNGPATVSDLWEAQAKRTEYAKRLQKAWTDTKGRSGIGREMDALLMPCTPWPASPKYGFTYDNYTSLWNVLDYCATTVPVCNVSSVKDVKPEYQGRNEIEKKIWDDYSPEAVVGCPVSIQLVGRRLHEEYLLGVTKVCDGALRSVGDIPC